ncbi:hypothetical protein ENUP19_0082G0089 [Entamoeba nuttalli]|uniref:Ankyrin repeat protein, putative n=2 Tax=Entamoeba nuttalli TaxID=412467 RepID=K2HGB4_ENTNP|nr:ankyrin repeat protein, putative [Entamoeba nuttalli P19]EKE41929.1 ankyrin repeat protein, putative [Entamoeba nuttalli P19]|eukprot:XP_008855730.1 ankyrin repeat protein, putative [Entamoeba nuttalli P19]
MATQQINKYTPVHWAIINNIPLKEEMLYHCNINDFDCYGIPGLHYAIHMQNREVIQWLFDHGADPLLRNKNGFNAFQEAVCTRNEQIIKITYEKTYNYYRTIYDERVIDGAETLNELHDFQFTLHWELQTWIPLGTYLLPSDNNVIRKRGKNLRLDMNIIGFNHYTVQKGNGSLIFFGEDKNQFKKGEVIFVNHNEKTVTKLCGCGTQRKLKIEDVLKTNVTTMKTKIIFDCKEAKTLLGYERNENINGINCKVYNVTPFWAELITRELPSIIQKPKHFKSKIYDDEYMQNHIKNNILLRKNEKEILRKKTCQAEMWIGKGSIELSEFKILMKFLSKNFDNFSAFEDFFERNNLTNDFGFPLQFKIPLAFSLSIVANIKDYQAVSPSEEIFEIPKAYNILDFTKN